jgi:hypothetical protein
MLKIPCNCAMMIVACIIVKYGTKMEIKNLTTTTTLSFSSFQTRGKVKRGNVPRRLFIPALQ